MDPGVPEWIHLTATLYPYVPALTRPEVGRWLWARGRAAWPEAIAALWMPDHPHLIVRSDAPEADRERLARMLGQLGRRFGVVGPTCRGASFSVIRSGRVLSRQVRYVALNPCRDRYVRCPLAWMFTTHRDVVGMVVDPWVTPQRLASALDRPLDDFVARHHSYVSSDPDADVAGTPLPVAAEPTRMSSHPLLRIAEAAADATRRTVADIRRRGPARALFVALAVDQGWRDLRQLAELCKCEPEAIRRLARTADPRALTAARLCLGAPPLPEVTDRRTSFRPERDPRASRNSV